MTHQKAITVSLKSCVIGLGQMGRNHARVCADLPGISLVGVADPSAESRDKYKPLPGVKVYEDYRTMLEVERPELVVVSVPTQYHCAVACDVMERGIHVLVEKPIAKVVSEADHMIAVAKKSGVKLMVGHLERFNPAVSEIKRRVAAREMGRIFQLHARRLSPFPARIQDVGVILDMATHDIDAMHYITGSRVVRVHAETAQRAHETCEDMLSGLMRFATGEVGVLDVSWLSPQKLRQLTVVAEAGILVADYLTQDLYWYKNGVINDTWEPATHFSGAVEGDVVKTYIPKREPLRVEHEAFVGCVRNDTIPEVTGEDGRAALQVALEMIRSGNENRIIFPQEAGSAP